MAQASRRHPGSAPGPWFVDDTCIDCDASRQCAPGLIGEQGGQSVFLRQPETAAEIAEAARALLACPTGSIGTSGSRPALDGLFPQELEDGVFLCGFNARSSFGASSFLAVRPGGNLLVDSPRFASRLVRAVEAMGGVADILLTHRDDVADAKRWADQFGARVWIHEHDADAAPFATSILRGIDRSHIRPDIVAIPVPGHTRGSAIYLLEDRFLFTGDSLYYSRGLGELSAFRSACWYSWPEQARSLARLTDLRFEWVLAGHGDRRRATPAWMRESLARLLARMGDPAFDDPW